MARTDSVTHAQAWKAAGTAFAVLMTVALTFAFGVVARAEAAAERPARQVERLEAKIDRLEQKIDALREEVRRAR